jgi:hypothetical protein
VSKKSPHRKLQKPKTTTMLVLVVAMKKNLLANLGNPKPCSRRPQNARHTQEEPWKYQATIQEDRVVVEEDKVQDDDGSKRTALLRVRDEPSAMEKARGIEERFRCRESSRPLRASHGGEHEVVV